MVSHVHMYKRVHQMLRHLMVKPIGSFSFILALHILFLVSYVVLMPAFEGADEPDHLRYIEAVFDGEKIHPIDRSDPRRYGIEIYQPPLYYNIAAFVARFVPVVFPDHLAINPDKNPNRPFLVHDHLGEIFPFDPLRKTLRFFRALSVLLGIAAFVIFARILRLAIPENPEAVNIILLVFALWPNNIQMFSVVSNDALAYLLSLSLTLALLHSLKARQPSWKQGLLIGVTLALGLLSKMTILITVAALFPVLIFDLILDRRRVRPYLKMLPAVLLPVFLLAGHFMTSRTIWYGSPTGEGLHNVLIPAMAYTARLSFAELTRAMVQILPGRFLADLCWQHLTLPLVSLQFFVLWLSSNMLMAIRIVSPSFRKLCREGMLHRVLVLSSLALMFVVLHRIFAKYVHVQIRHVWNLWPMTLLALPFAVQGTTFLRQVNRKRILNISFVALIAILVPVNFLVLYNYILMYKPAEGVSRPNLDYFTFTDCYAQSQYKAAAYLDTSGLTDVAAYRHFANKHDWENVLFHARHALEKGANEHEDRLMCARAFRSLGKPNEALGVLQEGGRHSPEGQVLEISLMIDIRRFDDAEERIRRLLPEAPPNVRVQLESMLKKIGAKPRNN